ncbi:hypothetical protein ECE50_028310 [Chitinophaga sp. Mgbs1]|uniref:Uncharacterized protein n=1 Tax=Chitinophaga solisilvae TaxID=1233460 RepID=A0A9Q5DC66_9BACT|nr:hypothetical protein [Chitinophaga solisilvae]
MLIKYQIEKNDKYGLDTTGLGKLELNNMLYEVFFFYGNEIAIKKGIEWMKEILISYPEDPSYIDTYASLLFKQGEKEEAIKWEQKAIDILSLKNEQEEVQRYMKKLEKMKSNQPTWIKN